MVGWRVSGCAVNKSTQGKFGEFPAAVYLFLIRSYPWEVSDTSEAPEYSY
jgi:hypothetical protein